MQHFSNPVIVTYERMIIIWVVFGFEEEFVFFISIISPYMGMTVNKAWPFEQTLNPFSTVGSTWNLVEIGQLISEEKVFDNIMIIYRYTAYEQGKITLAE